MGKRGYVIALTLTLFCVVSSLQAAADLVPTTFGFPVLVGGFPVAENYNAADTFDQPGVANTLFNSDFMANFGIGRGSLTTSILPSYTAGMPGIFSGMNAFPAFDRMLDIFGGQPASTTGSSPTIKPNPAPAALPTPPPVPSLSAS